MTTITKKKNKEKQKRRQGQARSKYAESCTESQSYNKIKQSVAS